MKKIDIPYFSEKSDLFKFLKDNKDHLEAQKKFEPKFADGVPFTGTFSTTKENTFKANMPVNLNVDSLRVRAIINTTNLMDNHYDVHLPGIWKKSLSENRMVMHLQEHSMKFDHIISDGNDLKAYTKAYTWKELGFPFEGNTEALVFDSTIKQSGEKARNEYMFEQYAKGHVKNHSVGMHYIKLVLCINAPDDEYYGAEFEAWEKYYPEVANKEFADEKGFFWAVKEAKVIEGSAVPMGSNWATPTQENNLGAGKTTPDEPPKGTRINYKYLTKNF